MTSEGHSELNSNLLAVERTVGPESHHHAHQGIGGKIGSLAAKERTEIHGYLMENTESILGQFSL